MRAGSGGSHRSSGFRSSSHSSGMHRVSSPRAGSSSSSSSWTHSTSHHSRWEPPHHHSSYPPPHHHYGSAGGSGTSVVTTVIIIFIIFIAVALYTRYNGVSGIRTHSTHNRVALEKTTFHPKCIVDEINYISDNTKAVQGLKTFWKATGVQPCVVFKAYDPELKYDNQKVKYAEDYYDKYVKNEYSFLFMYFAEKDDTEVGLMTHVVGKNAEAIMDDEAIDIFYNYIDKYWYSNEPTEDVLVKAYTQTANEIMRQHFDFKKVLVVILIVGVLIVVGITLIVIALIKAAQAAAKDDATRKILETPLEKYGDTKYHDLVDKYLEGEEDTRQLN